MLLDPGVDARATDWVGPGGVGVWTFPPGLTNVEWVVGAPDNFPALQNLLDDLAAADAVLDALLGPGTLALGALSTSLPTKYLLEGFLLDECPTGPTCRAEFVAAVTYYEQNATWTRDTPVPEPTAFLLLGLGLGAIAVRRRLKTRA
jgi:hypothetical protein